MNEIVPRGKEMVPTLVRCDLRVWTILNGASSNAKLSLRLESPGSRLLREQFHLWSLLIQSAAGVLVLLAPVEQH